MNDSTLQINLPCSQAMTTEVFLGYFSMICANPGTWVVQYLTKWNFNVLKMLSKISFSCAVHKVNNNL